MATDHLTFLKLGGSLITVKSSPLTARMDALERIAAEIAAWFHGQGSPRLLIGHGSGSFGHVPASRYGTRSGVRTREEWAGFAEVQAAAAGLNHIVMAALRTAGIPAVSLPPSAGALAEAGQIAAWETGPIRSALAAGLVPVVYGDAAFDRKIGATILSTEALFDYLARDLRPTRILIAGIEEGVWADYPRRSELIPEIDAAALGGLWTGIAGAEDPDVTGGMRGKVTAMLELVERMPELEIRIFGGLAEGSITQALSGEAAGTLLTHT